MRLGLAGVVFAYVYIFGVTKFNVFGYWNSMEGMKKDVPVTAAVLTTKPQWHSGWCPASASLECVVRRALGRSHVVSRLSQCSSVFFCGARHVACGVDGQEWATGYWLLCVCTYAFVTPLVYACATQLQVRDAGGCKGFYFTL